MSAVRAVYHTAQTEMHSHAILEKAGNSSVQPPQQAGFYWMNPQTEAAQLGRRKQQVGMKQ